MKKLLSFLSLPLLLLITQTAKAASPAWVTAYNLTGRMADGVPAHYGAVACKSTLRLGTRVHLVGLGDFVCEDRFGDENLPAMFDISLPGANILDCYQFTGYYDWWII